MDIDYEVFARRLEEWRKCPSAFIEELYGIKLLPYQKFIADNISKYKGGTRNPNVKWENYIRMCCKK